MSIQNLYQFIILQYLIKRMDKEFTIIPNILHLSKNRYRFKIYINL